MGHFLSSLIPSQTTRIKKLDKEWEKLKKRKSRAKDAEESAHWQMKIDENRAMRQSIKDET